MANFYQFLHTAHAHFRWLVVLVAIIAVIVFLMTWLGKKDDAKLDRTLMAILMGCIDLQWLMGVILLILLATTTGLSRLHYEHAFMLTLALILGHFAAKWKRSPATLRARNYLFVTLGMILLIILGVSKYPNGWPV
jgi:hypothetical protein